MQVLTWGALMLVQLTPGQHLTIVTPDDNQHRLQLNGSTPQWKKGFTSVAGMALLDAAEVTRGDVISLARLDDDFEGDPERTHLMGLRDDVCTRIEVWY